jgi:NADPH:quinone reductase-like Zn-dependent oxidoreductase
VLGEIGALIESGRFAPPDVQAFGLTEVARAHEASEHGHARGKIVLLPG